MSRAHKCHKSSSLSLLRKNRVAGFRFGRPGPKRTAGNPHESLPSLPSPERPKEERPRRGILRCLEYTHRPFRPPVCSGKQPPTVFIAPGSLSWSNDLRRRPFVLKRRPIRRIPGISRCIRLYIGGKSRCRVAHPPTAARAAASAPDGFADEPLPRQDASAIGWPLDAARLRATLSSIIANAARQPR